MTAKKPSTNLTICAPISDVKFLNIILDALMKNPAHPLYVCAAVGSSSEPTAFSPKKLFTLHTPVAYSPPCIPTCERIHGTCGDMLTLSTPYSSPAYSTPHRGTPIKKEYASFVCMHPIRWKIRPYEGLWIGKIQKTLYSHFQLVGIPPRAYARLYACMQSIKN